MKQAEILKALSLIKGQDTNAYCGKLATIFDFLKREKATITKSFVSQTGFGITDSGEIINDSEGVMIGCKLIVETVTGLYSFCIPIDNEFYYAVCLLLGIEFEAKEAAKKDVVRRFITVDGVLDSIRKAARFMSTDPMHPSMQCVCLDFSNEGLQVIATDCYRMYYSKPVNAVGYSEPFQLLIDPESAKTLGKLKSQNKSLHIVVYSDNTASINGVKVGLVTDHTFPKYKTILPDYKKSMEFDRVKFIANVKKVLPYANKATNMVNFHLNGTIAMKCEDVDGNFECDAEMCYISKNFPDTDISFNGKFMTDGLGIFKDTTLKMLSHGDNYKPTIFTNDTDSVLLLPMIKG